ncbi:hypothetical protein GGR28_001167 [Lewinella aquimaris]|uniref:DUF6438 domain-containing protein n=1 Tax=Neolewinella aquimaris TaxID=1835722 RepID=A0A840DZ54_9BACT|nr:DUF6438 domain-containing protein [Neolewinella aquimaris]MBB4078554.1 hypothetical protein [Neolewinella aquimaris]
MRKLALLYLLFALTFSCSRQPTRVASTPPPPAVPKPEAGTTDVAISDQLPERPAVPEAQGKRRLDDDDKQAVRDMMDRRNTARPATGAPVGAEVAPSETAVAEVAPVMEFFKSACYGDCDVYTLRVMPDGLLLLSVRNGLMGKGTYQRELDGFAARELSAGIDSLRTLTFAPLYPEEDELPTDLQFTRLMLPDVEGRPRTVTVYYDAPAALRRFIDRVETLVDNEIWRSLPSPRR